MFNKSNASHHHKERTKFGMLMVIQLIRYYVISWTDFSVYFQKIVYSCGEVSQLIVIIIQSLLIYRGAFIDSNISLHWKNARELHFMFMFKLLITLNNKSNFQKQALKWNLILLPPFNQIQFCSVYLI